MASIVYRNLHALFAVIKWMKSQKCPTRISLQILRGSFHYTYKIFLCRSGLWKKVRQDVLSVLPQKPYFARDRCLFVFNKLQTS